MLKYPFPSFIFLCSVVLLFFTVNSGFYSAQHDVPVITDDTICFSTEELIGNIRPDKHPDFVRIKTEHATRDGMFLRKEAYEAFIMMHDAALKEGITLYIISATRSYEHQKNLWESKWTG
ncbi:MAG: D-alanyl-D-alanine carboxypeptidase family protein, partial [Oscillospiraceae bacterium]